MTCLEKCTNYYDIDNGVTFQALYWLLGPLLTLPSSDQTCETQPHIEPDTSNQLLSASEFEVQKEVKWIGVFLCHVTSEQLES